MSFQARYFDGLQSKPYNVTLELTREGLHIRWAQGHQFWPFKEIRIKQEPVLPLDGILTCQSDSSAARLVIDDLECWDALAACMPDRSRMKLVLRHSWASVLFYAGCCVLALTLLFAFMPVVLERSAVLLPESYMVKLGDDVLRDFQRWPQCKTPEGVKALDKLISPLAQAAGIETYEVYVLQDRNFVNALAIPGGHIVVFQALIHITDSPEQLAGVLAHEIAHLKQRHSAKAIMRDTGMSILLRLAFSGTDLSGDVINFGDFSQRMTYSRQDETEADVVGYQLLLDAGISPEGMHEFLEHTRRFEGKHESEFFAFLRSHPYSDDRIAALKDRETSLPYPPALTEEEWSALRDICNPDHLHRSSRF